MAIAALRSYRWPCGAAVARCSSFMLSKGSDAKQVELPSGERAHDGGVA